MGTKVAVQRKICPVDGDVDDNRREQDDSEDPHQVAAQVQERSSHIDATSSSPLVWKLSVSLQRRIWCFILLHQVLNSILLTSLVVMYGSVKERMTVLWFLRYIFMFSQAQGFLTAVHAYVSAGYACLAIMFAYGALSMVWHSLRQGRLCYAAHPATQPKEKTDQGKQPSKKNLVVRFLSKSLAIYRAFGLRGEYFNTGFFVREVVESILQTTQAYKASVSLSNTFVNQSYGVLIFLNCFACVVLTHVYRSGTVKGRLVCVLVDLTLDFAWGTIIPLVMFWPYLELFRRYSVDPLTVLPLNVQREVESIVVLSMEDFVLSTFPFISSVANTRGIRRLLTDATAATAFPSKNTMPLSVAVIASTPNGVQVAPVPTSSASTPMSRRLLCRRRVWRPAFWRKLFHGLMLVHGIAILSISVSSRLDSSSPTTLDAHECLRRVYPWFSTNMACVGRILHCDAAGIAGDESEITVELQRFDAKSLSSLEFMGCSRLQVPSSIHRFQDLSVLTIQGSELLSWHSDAAIADPSFRAIQTIRLVNVTVSGPVDGLVALSLPIAVEWISMNGVTNTESLVLSQVDDNWKHLKYFYCDACSLTEFPAIIDTMDGLLELSLCGNSIETLTDHHIEHLTRLENVWLDGNPLTALPDSLWRLAKSLFEFSFQNTNVSEIPAWVNDIADSSLVMYGFGTPLCASESDNTATPHLTCVEMVY